MRRVWILVLLIAPLAGQDTPPDRGPNFYSVEKERALGEKLVEEYRRTARVIDDAEVKAYLNDVGQRIAAKAQGPPFTYTFELIDDDQILLHEPVAFPGGAVFVPASLILAAKSEDELAGMMAHAIAHIAARHGTKQATRGELVNQATIPLIFMGGWAGYAVRQNQAIGIPLGFLKFMRQNELAADTLAVQSMAAAGYNPAALADYVERVQPLKPPPFEPTVPYPDRETRLAGLRTAIGALPAASYPAHDGFAAIQEAVKRLDVKPAKAPPRLAR